MITATGFRSWPNTASGQNKMCVEVENKCEKQTITTEKQLRLTNDHNQKPIASDSKNASERNILPVQSPNATGENPRSDKSLISQVVKFLLREIHGIVGCLTRHRASILVRKLTPRNTRAKAVYNDLPTGVLICVRFS